MRLLPIVASCAVLVTDAWGQNLVDVEIIDGQVKMTSAEDGRVLMDPRGLTLHDGFGTLDVVQPQIEFETFPDGVDIIYTFTNSTEQAKPLGRLKLGIFSIGQDIIYREFRWFGEELTASAEEYAGMSIRYPLSLYSPVHVMHNDEWAVGVSLQYPVLDYQHDVTLSMVSPGGSMANGPGGRGWAVIYKMNHNGTEGDHIKMVYTASLAPGETQTYTVSIRATNKPDEWVRTLLPYRTFFHEQYGGVRYERDPRCMLGFIAAQADCQTEDNPEGWTNPQTLRPDVFCWQPWVDWMFERDNWYRMMMWMPGGTYEYERDTPFDFVRNWESDDNLLTALDPGHGFKQIENAGRNFGLWWSQSVNYSDSPGNLVGFDFENPEHVAAALAELDLAVATGATMIGLDTFTHKKCAMWDQYKWMQFMQQRHPHVKFIVEPITMDFMHTLAPAYFTGHNDLLEIPDTIEELWLFRTPHYLADFLNPGHEIVGAWRYWAYQFFDAEWTPEMAHEHMTEIANCGLAPLLITGRELDLTQSYDARETWHDTVPEDLLYFAPIKQPSEQPRGDVHSECLADMDMNGALTVLDFIAFQAAFEQGDWIADVNNDGSLDVMDFLAFQVLFELGCA